MYLDYMGSKSDGGGGVVVEGVLCQSGMQLIDGISGTEFRYPLTTVSDYCRRVEDNICEAAEDIILLNYTSSPLVVVVRDPLTHFFTCCTIRFLILINMH